MSRSDDGVRRVNERLRTVEMHTGGEPVRIVVEGYPRLEAVTLLGKRREALEHHDHIRRLLMFEPRGHRDMYGAIPVAADDPDADLAVLFTHGEGYSTMCGHAVIALGRWAVDSGVVAATPPETRLSIQVPCGLVEVSVETFPDRTGRVGFVSVPAFASALDEVVEVEGIGEVMLDLGYGGAFYAIVKASDLGLDLGTAPLSTLVERASRVSAAAGRSLTLRHPDSPDLEFVYGTIVTDGANGSESPSLNVCVFADRQVDRSPTGSGVTARMAVQHVRGEVAIGDRREFMSITGARFGGRIVDTTELGAVAAVRVEVEGHAFYTGEAVFTSEAGDDVGAFLID